MKGLAWEEQEDRWIKLALKFLKNWNEWYRIIKMVTEIWSSIDEEGHQEKRLR